MGAGMRLNFILITAPEGATNGLPDEAMVRALYTTATFTRWISSAQVSTTTSTSKPSEFSRNSAVCCSPPACG